ncbi:UbiH/UbiF family hydroxylase [Roseibium sp. MMSF_3412]|uniref:UbiH/UbiF family hydroxylase n=1 Tax=Roseibium sp. MMSF_3412 TaxID=3046712 RepID=UPI00273D4882|nr:UbiH/UbiF family hydroxylase [Roseibium sp. MMSF_3412]
MSKSDQSSVQDIVVVGGGPSGRIAAIGLAQLGLSVSLVAPVPNGPDGRTTALWQQSISFLERIGVWDELSQSTAPLAKMRMVDDTGGLIRAPEVIFDSSDLQLNEFGFNILNDKLNAVLEEKCGAEDTLTVIPEHAVSIETSSEHVHIRTASGESLRARLAVAADGRKSVLREAAGIEVKTWTYPQVAVVLNVEHRLPHSSISTEFHTKTGPFTLVPLPGNMSSIVCVETEEGAARLCAMEADALAMELERRAHSILGSFKLASCVKSFPLSGMNAHRLVGERIALIGEAAHVFPPIGAQGLNLSLRDIIDLTAVIEGARLRNMDPGDNAILQHYEKKRTRDIATRTNAVDILNRSLLTPFLPVQAARGLGLYVVDRIAPLKRFLMREGMAPASGFRRPG